MPVETCVFVSNTTTGIDTILRNLIYEPGDVVISFATTYTSFKYTLRYLVDTTPLEVKQIEYTLPVSDEYIVDAFYEAILDLQASNKNPRLALFDTINSLPGVRMPFERLTAICKHYNIYSCIDGAHGVGHIPLNLPSLDPDFFVSNCHKWLYVPRGCAVLYVPVRNQHVLRCTLPTGYGFDEGFVRNFEDLGTLDSTPYLCVQAALDWRSRLTWRGKRGEEAGPYILDLARKGGKAVAAILGTEVLENEEGTLGNCALTNIRLPLKLAESAKKDLTRIQEVSRSIMKAMIVEHQTAVNVYYYAGACWVRLSAQVYLTLEDFEHAGRRLKDLCEGFEGGRPLS